MISSDATGTNVAPELKSAFRQSTGALFGIGLFSGLCNVLALTGSIYMLQLYDRVLPSQSMATLVGLSVLMVLLYFGFGVLDVVRSRMLNRVGMRIDRSLRDRVLSIVLQLPLRTKGSDATVPIRDLDTMRGFMGGPGPVALFDLPWLPLYLALTYLLHPWLGMLGAGGAVILLAITLLTELQSRRPSKEASVTAAQRSTLAEAVRRNADTIKALGMHTRFLEQWRRVTEEHLRTHQTATDVTSTYGAVSKSIRMVLQSAVLGLGAYLVINGEATAGVMIAASILISRALNPIEIAIANWRGFVGARQSLSRLSKLLLSVPEPEKKLQLSAPESRLDVVGLCVAPPGQTQPVLQNVSFALEAGVSLGVIGPSAAGKSSLARTLVGAWSPSQGHVRLDNAALEQWHPDLLGKHIGYLPQEVELFEGTVAQNIARFEPDADSGSIFTAARCARMHDAILGLPDGYDTKVGDRGTNLSAGQRQRIGLARALYGEPFFVVLDEPNAHLDSDGDAALTEAIQSIKQRGGVSIVIAHRPSALAAVDKLLVLGNKQVQAFGLKDDVLKKVTASSEGSGHLRVISPTSA